MSNQTFLDFNNLHIVIDDEGVGILNLEVGAVSSLQPRDIEAIYLKLIELGHLQPMLTIKCPSDEFTVTQGEDGEIIVEHPGGAGETLRVNIPELGKALGDTPSTIHLSH